MLLMGEGSEKLMVGDRYLAVGHTQNVMRLDRRLLRLATPAVGFIVLSQAMGASPLESVSLTASHPEAKLPITLKSGQLYLLKSSGLLRWGKQVLNAESIYVAGNGDGIPEAGSRSVRAAPGRIEWFRDDAKAGAYEMIVTGVGVPLDLKLAHAAGKGAITIKVFPLSASSLGKPLESLKVSVMQVKEYSSLVTKPGTVYLLECIGQGRVGGGGLGHGDADYMDYRADGSGHEDIGDRNTDYGLGIDEADQNITPRKRWWGPFRLDHDYFMLFEGTGKPIQFYYYDVLGGYGDNSPTDRLQVNIFKTP